MAKKKTPQTKRVRVGKLQSVQEVAKFQARIIKKAVKGAGEVVNECYKLSMMASMLAKTLELSDLEKGVEALENTILSHVQRERYDEPQKTTERFREAGEGKTPNTGIR